MREMTLLLFPIDLLAALGLIFFLLYYPMHLLQESLLTKRINLPSWPTVLSTVAAIALFISTYNQYSKIDSARHPMSEARTNLGAIFACQVSYFAQAKTYGADFTILNWAPAGGSRYSYVISNQHIPPTRPGRFDSGQLDLAWPFTRRPATSATGFTAIAIGNIDGDSFLDAWSINDAKQFTRLLDDGFDEDLTGFLPQPPRTPGAQKRHRVWVSLRDKTLMIFKTSLPVLFLASLGLIYVFYLREEKIRERRKGRAE